MTLEVFNNGKWENKSYYLGDIENFFFDVIFKELPFKVIYNKSEWEEKFCNFFNNVTNYIYSIGEQDNMDFDVFGTSKEVYIYSMRNAKLYNLELLNKDIENLIKLRNDITLQDNLKVD